MRIRSKILLWCSALILSSVLLLPMVFQVFHILEKHEHKVCEDVNTHLHEVALDCSLCDFHPASLDYTLAKLPAFFTPKLFYTTVELFVVFTLDNCVLTNKQLRAPPLLS
ncbi:hypothetical protein [Eudoraea chungangensis]|uniref:hypothetical protein n=1 Tax=Eudoraea chungangensis TaxID=1481905 RepID=UPI0023EDBA70|nr:hypothetical protein [Eudoraea chungangensis]